MSVTKRIVCLANSRKMQGRCVAGREVIDGRPGPWIRPVSDRPTEEVSEEERRYEDGSDPRVLDVIDIPLIEPRPKDYQTENWLLDPKYYWVRAGAIGWKDLAAFSDVHGPLWRNEISSSNGLNDRVPVDLAIALDSSLGFIRVKDLNLKVFKPSEAFGNKKRRVQGIFSFDGVPYRLWVTDSVVEPSYLGKPDGEYMVAEAYLSVSLSEPYKGYCYKLIAAVVGKT